MFPAALPPPSPPAAAATAAAPQTTAAPSPLLSITGPTQRVESHGYAYTVIGNRLLSDADVAAALQGASDPRAAIGALKQAYVAKGYFLVALVGQENHHEVTVRVVQGRITHVEGDKHLAAFFKGLEGDDTIVQRDVIRPSILAQAYAATNGEQPQVTFKPAPEFAGSTLEVNTSKLKDSLPVGANLSFGNFGNRYAGHYIAQGQVTLHHAGFTLQLNQAHALPSMSRDTRGAFYRSQSAKLTWVTPLGIFGIDGSKTNYHLGDAFKPLFPTGHIETFGLTGTQLLYADETRRWSLNEGVHRIHDANTVFQGLFTLYDRRFNLVDLATDFSWRFAGLGKLPAALSTSAGVHWGAAEAGWGFQRQTGAPQSHFMQYTGSVGLTQSLPRGYSLKLDVSGQASPDTLPSYQQWVLGGINNLTAYLPGTVAGDRGYLARFTAQAPVWTLGPVKLAPSLFVEHGSSRFAFIPHGAPVWQRLTDAGAALSVGVPVAHLSATLAWAKPMDAYNVAPATSHGQRSHLFFYLNAGF